MASATHPDEVDTLLVPRQADERADDTHSLECGFRTLMSRVRLREARQARLFEGSVWREVGSLFAQRDAGRTAFCHWVDRKIESVAKQR